MELCRDASASEVCQTTHVGPYIQYDYSPAHREAVSELCRRTGMSYSRCRFWLGHGNYDVDRALALARQNHQRHNPHRI